MDTRHAALALGNLFICLSVGFAREERPAPKLVVKREKAVIQQTAQRLVAESGPLPARPGQPLGEIGVDQANERAGVHDVGKADIELPTKALLAGVSPALPNPSAPPPENPRVAPGKVLWHPDLETACTASGKSGKAVLHFQLLGNLDDRFC
ncbi:MAG: hypothetical protein GTO53_10545 [Planctomycetales bacterium]|nr:hypothetical protein [Planctomycetales bacterium]NIM09560.1 hypothetical protein [Planctomycetales bacterium]NIN09048.1 hypothetical protein [Planctomycetales bacterium]NIN78161.1 hypothetical protein [Planctomycetales bacterium]NIO35346.1 hypothetical protein [Planctomycetales bacterium]